MKFKHVIASLSLSMFTAFGLAAGFGMSKEAKAVKADAEPDSMISVVIDLADAVGYTDFHQPEVHYYDGVGGTIDSFADLHLLTGTYYTANLAYDSSSQSIDNIQFLFKQNKDKWSNSIPLDTKASYVYHYAFKNTWTGDNWDVEMDTTWSGVPRIRGDGGFADTNFVADVASRSYKVTVDLTAGSVYQIFYGKWNFGAIRQSSVDAYLSSYSLNNFSVKLSGRYEIDIYNSYEDGGIIQMTKYEVPVKSYIYYVLENNVPTNDYIYAWGGSEQFGAWPGTKITEIEDVEEVSGNGVLHFEGSETPKLIYCIPITTGYPVGDSHFKFNNNNDWESEAREIHLESAYWYTGEGSADAGDAIDFLVTAESYRNSAEDFSVCNIDAESASFLVSFYNSLEEGVRNFIDSSSVYTYKRDGSEGNELVSYRVVVEQLAELANIPLVGLDRYFNSAIESNTMVVVIISIAAASALAFTLLLVFKKKRQK